VLESLPPQTRKACVRSLYSICGRRALLPKPLAIPLCYDPMGIPSCRGGFADVWKGQYNGREVASKVLRVYQNGDLERIRRVGRPSSVVRIRELTVSRTEVLQRGHGMECPLPSERATAIRRDHDRDSVRDGIGMDGEREYQRVYQGG